MFLVGDLRLTQLRFTSMEDEEVWKIKDRYLSTKC